jgi:hypothetical protein
VGGIGQRFRQLSETTHKDAGEQQGRQMQLRQLANIDWTSSDLMRAHPEWPNRGLEWIEAFDGIDLVAMQKTAKANRWAVQPRAAIATMLYEKLAPAFEPPEKVRPPRKV